MSAPDDHELSLTEQPAPSTIVPVNSQQAAVKENAPGVERPDFPDFLAGESEADRDEKILAYEHALADYHERCTVTSLPAWKRQLPPEEIHKICVEINERDPRRRAEAYDAAHPDTPRRQP